MTHFLLDIYSNYRMYSYDIKGPDGQSTVEEIRNPYTTFLGATTPVYLAHDFREEEQTYDILRRSVVGDLLTDIYLETRRGLELANQGGARAKVKEIELTEIEVEPKGGAGFVATATWVVRGSVGHWGHLHERTNRYRAQIDVRAVDSAWKIAGLELLQEERL